MPGQIGNKGGGRPPMARENAYFKKLDKVLPEVVDFLIEQVRVGRKSKDKWEKEMALKAANILNNKAPQRVEGPGDAGEFVFKVMGGNYAL